MVKQNVDSYHHSVKCNFDSNFNSNGLHVDVRGTTMKRQIKHIKKSLTKQTATTSQNDSNETETTQLFSPADDFPSNVNTTNNTR